LDHVAGLTFLLDTAWERNLSRITVHGEADKLAAVREHLLCNLLFPAPLNCQWQPLSEAPQPIAGAKVTHFPLAHPGGVVGFRLDWPGKSLAYVTDTTATPDAAYVESIRHVDLLVHECNFRDREHEWAVKTGHSSTSLVALVAAQAEVKRLVVVHFNPLEEADDPIDLGTLRRIFPHAELGRDQMEIEF
jgi:ribonuclease BN (tRNA processing enzyme)